MNAETRLIDMTLGELLDVLAEREAKLRESSEVRLRHRWHRSNLQLLEIDSTAHQEQRQDSSSSLAVRTHNHNRRRQSNVII